MNQLENLLISVQDKSTDKTNINEISSYDKTCFRDYKSKNEIEKISSSDHIFSQIDNLENYYDIVEK